MITSKELQYVASWANKVPMPGEEYSKKVIKEIKDCVQIFIEKYKDKEYNLILSNSEEITFEILESNLCHMMGIDYTNIKGAYFDNYRKEIFNTSASLTSYELLTLILEYADKVVENDNNPKCPEKIINYYKSGIKCEIFKKLSDFSKFNFGVLNDEPGQKHLFLPSNEPVCPYFMMGIKPNDEGKYFVFGLIAPEDPKSFFNNKEVVIPTQILVSDCEKLVKTKATAQEKINLLSMYKNIINLYNIPNNINIYSDYEELLFSINNNPKIRTLQ